ncbi:MAG: hypothetical protein EHM50_08990 [Lysobacterales bacterium]|nr:MAG: hypothetical protein EHM50_08990 [Xanthomonadales bacterium]
MPIVEGYPRPQWRAIRDIIDSLPSELAQEHWCAAARAWLNATARHLGSPYAVCETAQFLVLSPLSARQTELVGRFVERAWKQIVGQLDSLVDGHGHGYGKGVVMLFETQDAYYEYSAFFYPDGEHPLSAGVFLNAEYAHVAIPYHDIPETEATIAHELTHCYLRRLPIPLWLNEGLAVTFENEICGNRPLRMDPDRLAEHHAFWNEATIQEFWSGGSFRRTDEGNELSYELARYCVRALAHDREPFLEFVRGATFKDGGEAAALAVYGSNLGGLIEQFFGPGKWDPYVSSLP